MNFLGNGRKRQILRRVRAAHESEPRSDSEFGLLQMLLNAGVDEPFHTELMAQTKAKRLKKTLAC